MGRHALVYGIFFLWQCIFPLSSRNLPHSSLSYLVVICNDCCIHSKSLPQDSQTLCLLCCDCVCVYCVPFDTCLLEGLHTILLVLLITASFFLSSLAIVEGESVEEEGGQAPVF